jgi:hypothetical protein
MTRDGVVLVEVLAAIAILAVAGLATVAHVASLLDTQQRVLARETEMERAESMMGTLALLDRTELSQSLGMRELGRFAVWIDRPEPSLFRIGIAPVDRPSAELLATLLHRPEAPPAAARGAR